MAKYSFDCQQECGGEEMINNFNVIPAKAGIQLAKLVRNFRKRSVNLHTLVFYKRSLRAYALWIPAFARMTISRKFKKIIAVALVFQFLTIPLYPVLTVSTVYAQPVRDQYYNEEPQEPINEPEPEYQAPNVEENITPRYYPPAPRYVQPVYEPVYQAPNEEENEVYEEEPVNEELPATTFPDSPQEEAQSDSDPFAACLGILGEDICNRLYGVVEGPAIPEDWAPGAVEQASEDSGGWGETISQWPAEAWEWVAQAAEETGKSAGEIIEDSREYIASIFGGEGAENSGNSPTDLGGSIEPKSQDPVWGEKIANAQNDWDSYKAQALAEDPEAAALTRERLVSSLGLDSGATDDQILASFNSGSGELSVSGTPADLTVAIGANDICAIDTGCFPVSGDSPPQFDLLYNLTHIPGPVELGVRLLDGFLTNGAGGLVLDSSAQTVAENNVEEAEKELGVLKGLEAAGVTDHLNADGTVDHAKAAQEYLRLYPEAATQVQPYLSAIGEVEKKGEAFRESALSFATGGGSDGLSSAIQAGEEWKNTAERLDTLVFNRPEVWAVLKEDPSIYVPGDPDGNIDMAALARATRRYYQAEGNESGLRLANTTVESAEKAEGDYVAGVAQTGAVVLALGMGGASGGVVGALGNLYLPFGIDDAVAGAVNSRNASRLADAVGDVAPRRAPGTEEVPEVREVAKVETKPQGAAPTDEYAWYDPRKWVGMKPQEETPVARIDEPEQVAQGTTSDPVRMEEPEVQTAPRAEDSNVEAPAQAPAAAPNRAVDPNPEAEVPRVDEQAEIPAPRIEETPVEPEIPTQIADAPTPIRPEVQDSAKAELPCAAALPSDFQLVREVYAQDGGRKPCNPLDPRDWSTIVGSWFGKTEPEIVKVPDPQLNQADELAEIEPVNLDPVPELPVPAKTADLPIDATEPVPVPQQPPVNTFQDDFAARLNEEFPDGGEVKIGTPKPYSEGSPDTYISKKEGQVLLWTADQADGGLPPIVKNINSNAPRGSKTGTKVINAWEQTMADKGYRVVGANNVETRVPPGQSRVRIQDGERELELTPAEAFWWGRGYRPYIDGQNNSNKLWVKPLTPEGQIEIDTARRLAQDSNNPYVDFTKYLDTTPRLSDSKVGDEVIAGLSPSSTRDEIQKALRERGYLDREANLLAYEVQQKLDESQLATRAVEPQRVVEGPTAQSPDSVAVTKPAEPVFDQYGQIKTSQNRNPVVAWVTDQYKILDDWRNFFVTGVRNGYWNDRLPGNQPVVNQGESLAALRQRLSNSVEVKIDDQGKIISEVPKNADEATVKVGGDDASPPCDLSFAPFDFIEEAKAAGPCPTRVQKDRGDEAFEGVLESYGGKPGVTQDLFPRFDDGKGGKTLMNIKPGDAGHLLSPKYPDSDRIIQLTPEEVLKLEEGKHYNYIITSDKRIFIIERRNGMEIGEKHQQLGGELWKFDPLTAEATVNKNIGVVMAGEARVEGGELLMDLRSGTFSRMTETKGLKGVWASGQEELSKLEDVVEGITGFRPLGVRQVDVKKRNVVEFELDKELAERRAIAAPIGSDNLLLGINDTMKVWMNGHPKTVNVILGASFGTIIGTVVGIPMLIYYNQRSPIARPLIRSGGNSVPNPDAVQSESENASVAPILDEPPLAPAEAPSNGVPPIKSLAPAEEVEEAVRQLPVISEEAIVEGVKSSVEKRSTVIKSEGAGCGNDNNTIWIREFEDGYKEAVENYGKIPGQCGTPLPGGTCKAEVSDPYGQCGGTTGIQDKSAGVEYEITRTIACDKDGKPQVTYSSKEVGVKGYCPKPPTGEQGKPDLKKANEICNYNFECGSGLKCDSVSSKCLASHVFLKIEKVKDEPQFNFCGNLALSKKSDGAVFSCYDKGPYKDRKVQIKGVGYSEFCWLQIIDLGPGENCAAKP